MVCVYETIQLDSTRPEDVEMEPVCLTATVASVLEQHNNLSFANKSKTNDIRAGISDFS